MKDPHANSPVDADEQQLSQHYRRHQDEEPSAALDARILAAAREQARPRATVLARLHGWLFGHSPRLRWSLALGSVAALGLGLGLSLKTLERVPAGFDSALPAAPSLQRQAAPAPAQKTLMAESAAVGAQEAMADAAAAPPARVAPEAMGKAQGPRLEAELAEALREILRLREEGEQGAAAARIEALRQRYPQLDIEALLVRQQAADELAR
ncbi:hypothetical protein LPB260_28185 [Pseudomonas sp. LPB0260]|uniref:hypothetical protein n=1 Tax=Pseudomonas sp. LPB0260 TaxID=2614442 RepID=UPI0015C23B92|nr:hypothetical protein [Pseudomonas sp. LPB0260]QLC74561.1 hypothetical protein LPB260_13235 [Pseudomonas sp. LPB0260]QLC77330.1 hypothetical protein LPB260_28185 [Pseudomonas sp. LPB0260]